MSHIRPCDEADVIDMLTIVNCAAEAYRAVIPPDQWHEPYMSAQELRQEIAAGVVFAGYELAGKLVGIMGIQPVLDSDLIRHAYVRPSHQRRGIGAALIGHLRRQSTRPLLVGTWAAAHWAVAFYQRHGFQLCRCEQTFELLRIYWSISERQAENSVVLANPPLAPPGHRPRGRTPSRGSSEDI